MKCGDVLSTYFDTLKSRAACKELPNGRLSIVLPFLYPDHDNVEVFVRQHEDGEVVVSDLGETLRRLDIIDMDFTLSGSLAFKAERIAKGFGASIKKGVIFKQGTMADVGELISDVSSVCMAIGDLAYGGRGYQPMTFHDEVEKVLTANNLSFNQHHPIEGKITGQYHVDFQVLAQNRVSLVQSLDARTRSGVRNWVNATFRMWTDVKAGAVVRKVSLLNDAKTKISQEDEQILKSVSDVYRWSDKKKFLQFLQGA